MSRRFHYTDKDTGQAVEGVLFDNGSVAIEDGTGVAAYGTILLLRADRPSVGDVIFDDSRFFDASGSPQQATIAYSCRRGLEDRRIIPYSVHFGTTVHHPDATWLLRARCLDRGAMRDFGLSQIKRWR